MFKPETFLTPWVFVTSQRIFSFPYHTVETEYAELSVSGTTGRSYKVTGPARAPSLRSFTLNFPTMLILTDLNGQLSPLISPEINLLALERFYQDHRMAKPFVYDHPLFGWVRCRFGEPLKIPQGIAGGGGSVESFSTKLVEEPWFFGDAEQWVPEGFVSDFRAPGYLDFPKLNGRYIFDFPNYRISSEYKPESNVIPLGGGYTFATMPSKPEMRIFRLSFPLLFWKFTLGGKVDWTTDPTRNLARLELLYDKVRTSDPFWFTHPVYGQLLVRFDEPLKIPAGETRNCGWIGPIELTLLEVPQ